MPFGYHRRDLPMLFRSAAVGAVATLLDLLLLFVLIDLLGVHPALANVPALALGLAVQLVGNKRFAFRDRGSPMAPQILPFARVEAIAFVLNAVAFHVLGVWLGLHFVLARFLGEGAVYLGFSFPRWRRIFQVEEAP